MVKVIINEVSWTGCPGRAVIDILLIPIGLLAPSMVARTICVDSVLNHPDESPWMKRQSTKYQGQVYIDIIMNVPP
ncbi:hypothetical protein Bca52824_001375 [Brassica carinata]|uniref:Uncharacterized protein n=1 Tax=Brassica carinata TaxID=52824 RepID=A0A8X7WK04_BRACI|nr:hypothetical protein Bca52824_001375 [Brassica carinata]